MKHVTIKPQRDKQMIEAVVRRFGPLSRSAIHELTDLQHSEISRLARELLDEGKLTETGRGNNPKGRKQVLLSFNEEHRFIIGVSFDDESVLASVMNLFPKIKSEVREATRLSGGSGELVHQLLSCAKRAMHDAGVSPKNLAGIGVAGSGLVDSRRGQFIMSSTVEVLKDVSLQRIFEETFGAPTLLENLTRAKTVGERSLGAGEMAEDMILVEYGRTGIGAGIVINGKLMHGSGFAAGEFGHTHIMGEGPACRCGSFGCLEALAGAAALESRIRRAISEGSSSEVLPLAGGDPHAITGWMVFEAARNGDKTCLALVEQIGNHLGLGLANLVNLFNPSVLVVDQRLKLAGGGLLDQMMKVIKRQALREATRNLTIRFGELGTEAIILGLGVIVLDRHFEIPALKPPRFMIEPLPGAANHKHRPPNTERAAAPARLTPAVKMTRRGIV
ncbi:MAG TPA: ROK family protein [Terriglobia bacterium]|nr:ROK family protein [Terriglobia bacterium]